MAKLSTIQLLQELKRSHMYPAKIAKKYNLTPSAISQRIKRLKKRGVLKEILRTSYKQFSLKDGWTKKLNKTLTSQKARESVALQTKVKFEPHKFIIKFPLTHFLDREKLNSLFPIKQKKRNWDCYYSKDKSIKLTTKNIFFYIRLHSWERETEANLERTAIARATSKAIGLNQQYSLGINKNKPSLSQEIRIKHPFITQLYKNQKDQVYYKGANLNKVYHGDKTCLETTDREVADRIAKNLAALESADLMNIMAQNVETNTMLAINIE